MRKKQEPVLKGLNHGCKFFGVYYKGVVELSEGYDGHDLTPTEERSLWYITRTYHKEAG